MHGWKTASLGDVCVIEKTKFKDGELPYVGMEDIVSGTGKFVGSREPKKVGSSTFQFTPNHLLYGRLRPYLNKVLLPDFEGHCSSEIFPLLPKAELDKSFLFYWITSEQVVKEINRTCTGARMPRANVNEVLKFDIPIPPIEEQKRIVAILDEAFAGIDTAIANTEKNLANARELFDSYLNSVFTNQEGGWVNTSVENLVNEKILDKPLDGNHGDIHPKKADFVDTGIPFVMASDLINGEVDQVHCNFITKKQGDSLRKGFACDGDVLLSHKGTIGRVAVLNTEHEYVMLTPQVTYYRIADKDVIHNRYLYYYFQSPKFQNEICEIAGAGSTRAYIGITKQLELPVSYPSKDVQIELATKFDALKLETQRLENIYKQKLTSLSELKQSLLQKAFSGELTAEGDKLMDEAVA